MLGVPAPDVAVDKVSGTMIKFWNTLERFRQAPSRPLR